MTDTAVSQTPAPEKSTPAGESNDAAKVTLFTLLAGVVIRPVEAFKQLREAKRSYWWVVLVTTMVLIFILAMADANVQLSAIRSFMVTSEGGRSGAVVSGAGPSAQAEGGAAMQMASISPLTLAIPKTIGDTIVTLIDYLLRALVIFLMSMLLGGKATFKESFRTSAWTTLPAAIRRLIQSVAVALTGGAVASGFSAALTTAEMTATPLLGMLLGYMDLYTLWSMLLLGIGAAVTGKLSKGKAAISVAIYVGIALVGILVVFAIQSAITNAFAPAGGPRGGRAGG